MLNLPVTFLFGVHKLDNLLKLISSFCFHLYSFRDLQKATHNFTTLIGKGAFGPVYKAQMSTGETVAVKVLATDSKQGEKEFQTEVLMAKVQSLHPIMSVRPYFMILSFFAS